MGTVSYSWLVFGGYGDWWVYWKPLQEPLSHTLTNDHAPDFLTQACVRVGLQAGY